MIRASYRFHGYGSLRYVFSKGKTYKTSHMILRVTKNPRRRYSRVAIVVSKKVLKSAVGRNRIRRRLFALIAPQLECIDSAHDLAIIVTSAEVRTIDHITLCREVDDLFHQADLCKNG